MSDLGVHDHMNGVFVAAASRILMQGDNPSPRGKGTQELLAAQFTLARPRNRMPVIPGRKWSLAYAAGELAWYLSGEDDLEFIRYYAPSYGSYSDDGKRLHGAYGPRIFGPQLFRPDQLRSQPPLSAWERCRRLLEADPDTRQAVIPVLQPHDVGKATKDYPCTVALQFLRRAGELHLIVTMRSNDLWRGTLYDAFCFTALQELMARSLGLDLGHYYHQAGSLHVYHSDATKCHSALATVQDGEHGLKPDLLVAMPPLLSDSWATAEEWLQSFLTIERACRLEFRLYECGVAAEALLKQELTGGGLMTLALLWKKAHGCVGGPEDSNWGELSELGGAIKQKVGKTTWDHCFQGGVK